MVRLENVTPYRESGTAEEALTGTGRIRARVGLNICMALEGCIRKALVAYMMTDVGRVER